MDSFKHRAWLIPVGLIILSVVPVVMGIVRLVSLAARSEITPENSRFFAEPLPVVVHVLGATIFCLLGAFQFAPTFRTRHPRLHRKSASLLLIAGLFVAASGIWMAQFYSLPPSDGDILRVVRLTVGLGMILSLIAGLVAVRRHDFAAHEAWMMRAYGLGMGAGTQVLTGLPWLLVYGMPDVGIRTVLMTAGWLINVAVVEIVLARRSVRLGRMLNAA